MEEACNGERLKADLQTAQNRMFSFVAEAMDRVKREERVAGLLERPAELGELYGQVKNQVFDLLRLPMAKRNRWHMGIADSGKRTIELLVNYLCPAQPEQNALVDTENYVGFNKFSAAAALEKQKGLTFVMPFKVPLGCALTINSETEFAKLTEQFEHNRYQTLWLSWNSTSTGIRERMGKVIASRNAAQSTTLVVADAASLPLFSNEWRAMSEEHLPDAFFFSLRKQGLPYDGPNDEANQARNSGSLLVFNDRALDRAREVAGESLYNSPSLAGYAEGRLTSGEQRSNHIMHLLKLRCALDFFLGNELAPMAALDHERSDALARIRSSFSHNGCGGGFSLFSDPDAQSDSVYILEVPGHAGAKDVVGSLKKDGILISLSMHPKMDIHKYVRFAFYPGNSGAELDCLIERLKSW